MVPLRAVTATFLSTVVFLAALPVVDAQNPTTCEHPNIGCCGDIQLILLNPDLQPDSQGFIRASGNFFVQFQAIGDGADDIATFGFSFGAYTTDFPEDVCDLPSEAWFTGQQVLNYRADTDASDGFFINLQTGLVPDGRYSAALHAYDANDNELARFWASAVVENCDQAADPVGLVERCGDDPAQMTRNDFIQPWPIVLPGDGVAPEDVNGFTLEFAEELSLLKVTLNGLDITAELAPWDGRLWDDDLKPGYGPNGLLAGTPLTEECNQTLPEVDNVHKCSHLGVAYLWEGRPLDENDLLRVEAVDLAGNRAVKDLHIGSGITGGAISGDLPIIDWTVADSLLTTEPTREVQFSFQVTNRGGGQGHPFADEIVPEGWAATWDPTHVPLDPGQTAEQRLVVTPPAGTPPGSYPVTAFMNYTSGGTPKTLRQDLTVDVDFEGAESFTDTTTVDGTGEDSEGSPAPLLVLVAAVMLAIAAVRRRTE